MINSDTDNPTQETVALLASLLANCQRVRPKLKVGSASHSLNTNRIKALCVARDLLMGQAAQYTRPELEQAMAQIASIQRKSQTGIRHAKPGSATHTRFTRLIDATQVALNALQAAVDACP